nr:VAN3-binding protein-like isoform X2 [Coffea arabica]
MDEAPEELRIRGTSLITQHKSSPLSFHRHTGSPEDLYSTRAQKHFKTTKRALASQIEEPMDTPESPISAMEFLCRPWSPSASNFLQLFPSSYDRARAEDHENQPEEALKHTPERNQVLIINEKFSRMNLNHVKGWPKGKSLSGFFRSCKEKKKDEIRCHTAKLHAALSLTELAAAIARFATSTSTEAQNINRKGNGETRAIYEEMGGAVATAAALMTTVCAEAAESLGADRAQLASAVNSGLAIGNPIDMMAVTATTSTCLRGAAILKSRTMADSLRIQGLLRACTEICIITPSGRREHKWVTIHSKPKQITLSFKKKYFGGTLSISKEYKLICIEEAMEGEEYFFLSLRTNNGIIKLLFKDQTQLNIWISAISSLLKMAQPQPFLS